MVNLDPKVCPKCGQQFEGDFCPFCGEAANPLSAMDDLESQFGDFNQEMAKVEEEAKVVFGKPFAWKGSTENAENRKELVESLQKRKNTSIRTAMCGLFY